MKSSIVFTNQKGGVAKTTTAHATAAGLHSKGYTVLMVDMDPQGNLSFAAGVDESERKTLYDVLKGNGTAADALHTVKPGLDLLTVGLAGTAADMELVSRTAREYMLSEIILSDSKNYDFCVIDTAPTLGLLTLNALTAADFAIIPMCLDVFSLQGMEQLAGFIENVQKYTNSELKVSGLLRTRCVDRLNITQALQENVKRAADMMETSVFDTVIHESVAVRETQLLRGDLYAEAPKAAATLDYIDFVDELLTKEGLNDGK